MIIDFLMPIAVGFFIVHVIFKLCNFAPRSFVVIFTGIGAVTYLVSTLIILTLNTPELAIETELWEGFPSAILIFDIGTLGFLFGLVLLLFTFNKSPYAKVRLSALSLTPMWLNISLVSTIIPVIATQILTGTFFHKDIYGTEYNFDVANAIGFIGYFSYLAYAGLVLQLRNFVYNPSKSNKFCFWLLLLLIVVPQSLSGSRISAIIPLVITILYYVGIKSDIKRSFRLLFISSITIVVLIIGIEQYRLGEFNNDSNSQLGYQNDNSLIEITAAVLGRRLADIASVSYIVSIIPSKFEYRYFDDMSYFPAYLLPTSLRPDIDLNYNYDAINMMEKYRFRTEIGGSSPIMFIGEAYERFGVLGVFIIMFFMGATLAAVDRYLLIDSVFRTTVWAMLTYGILNMHSYSFIKVFVLFTRQIAIFIIIAYLVDIIARTSNCKRLK